MGRECSKECSASFFFQWTEEGFSLQNCPSRNLRFFFTAELFACFQTQPSSEVFKNFRFADNEFYVKG